MAQFACGEFVGSFSKSIGPFKDPSFSNMHAYNSHLIGKMKTHFGFQVHSFDNGPVPSLSVASLTGDEVF